ncbi:MAG TPA: hypothetical protein VH374_19995 [Polyangia bacterium]|nr:hypothetical protein [Polyangia bacterium]
MFEFRKQRLRDGVAAANHTLRGSNEAQQPGAPSPLRDPFQIGPYFHTAAKAVAGGATLVENFFRFDRLYRTSRTIDYDRRQREEHKQ